MRLIATFKDITKAQAFSSYLKYQGIEHEVEITPVVDWGSPDYGIPISRVWILEEDQMEQALQYYHEYEENPHDPKFKAKPEFKKETIPPPPPPKMVRIEKSISTWDKQPIGILTLYLILLCTLLYFYGTFTAPHYEGKPITTVPYPVLYSSQVKKTLLYDWPQTFTLFDKVVKKYGVEKLRDPNDLPQEGVMLYNQAVDHPFWRGFYEKVVKHIREPQTKWTFDTPMFEKIRQGEVWRLLTPAFLHSDLIHLLFNMLWLLVLGKQMEQRIGIPRLLLFIIITGIFSNTAQYLMSGANFIGFSGVLCAQIAFIWSRQKYFAWEGYQLQPATIAFIAIVILVLFLLQVFAFLLEITTNQTIVPGIANTAHLSGALIGLFLGRMQFFSWRN